MIAELQDTMTSLTALMNEECALLGAGGGERLAAVAAAKGRVTASLETQIAALDRTHPEWRGTIGPEERTGLASRVEQLQEAAIANAGMLARHIDLSREWLDAISAEARRLSGTRTDTYQASGGLRQAELPTPISINTSL